MPPDSYVYKQIVNTVKKIQNKCPYLAPENIWNNHKDIQRKIAQLNVLSEIREINESADSNKIKTVNVISILDSTQIIKHNIEGIDLSS